MDGMTIGQVARKTGVSVDAIRLYERQGLLKAKGRSSGNYRLFGPDGVDKVRFLIKARQVGLTLAEAGELLRLQARPGTGKAQVKKVIQRKRRQIEEKLETLQKLRKALLHLEASCDGKGSVGDCPILHHLH